MTNVWSKSPFVFVTPIQSQITLVESENRKLKYFLFCSLIREAGEPGTPYDVCDKGYVGIRTSNSFSILNIEFSLVFTFDNTRISKSRLLGSDEPHYRY
jgi:hypothetical protein